MSLSVSAYTHGLAFARSATARCPVANFENIYIVSAQWVTAFAMCLRSFFGGGCGNHVGHVSRMKILLEQRNMEGYAFGNPPRYYVCSDSSFVTPVFSDHADTIELNPDISSSIAVLVFSRRPNTIFRRIWAVIVLAFNGVVLWPIAHIGKKIVESLSFGVSDKPSVANKNSPSTVILKSMVVRVVATTTHRAIYNVKRMQSARRF